MGCEVEVGGSAVGSGGEVSALPCFLDSKYVHVDHCFLLGFLPFSFLFLSFPFWVLLLVLCSFAASGLRIYAHTAVALEIHILVFGRRHEKEARIRDPSGLGIYELAGAYSAWRILDN